MQPDPKMSGATDRGGDEGGPKYDMKIGMYIMRGKAGMMRKVPLANPILDPNPNLNPNLDSNPNPNSNR